MSINQDERPRFYEGQYLGAEDLSAAVEYGRIQRARHMLGGHTWGIAMGLQLREVDSPWGGGNVDVYVQPGYAWDGFGRPVVVLARYQLRVDLFKDQREGLVKVWLRYSETKTREPRYGFGVCSVEDQAIRIQETFAVAIGDFSRSEQHDNVTVAEEPYDALKIYKSLHSKDVLISDESVPFQAFPDLGAREGVVCQETDQYSAEPVKTKTARWLIPLGYVRWKKGVDGNPGYFGKLYDTEEKDKDKIKQYALDLKASRSVRRYLGAVAENIYSADGVIRLQNREMPSPPADEKTCEEQRLQVDDAKSSDMTVEEGNLSITDLVWIEGNLRAKGDVKLFGKKIDFRDTKGSDDKAPLCIQRMEDNKLLDDEGNKGKDLQLVIGNSEKGTNRLAIGPLNKEKFTGKVVVQDDGKVGIQTASPQNTLDVKGNAVIGTNYAGLDVAKDDGLLVEGNVGIGTPEPDQALTINGTEGTFLNVKGSGGTYEVLFGADSTGGIVSTKTDHDLQLRAGNDTTRMIIKKDGNIGIGTTSPAVKLQIQGGSDAKLSGGGHLVVGPLTGSNIAVDENGLMARSSGNNAPLSLQADGGDVIIHSRQPANNKIIITDVGMVGLGTATPNCKLAIQGNGGAVKLYSGQGTGHCWIGLYTEGGSGSSRSGWLGYGMNGTKDLTIKNEKIDGNVILTPDRNVGIGIESPSAKLHVADSINGDAAHVSSHVALIENTSHGNSADVLALQIGRSNPTNGNNYISFFSGANLCGSIEGYNIGSGAFISPSFSDNTAVCFKSGSGDYAEYLQRLDKDEVLEGGEIVGVFGGKITKKTANAQHLLAITSRPIVVGNAPKKDIRHLYNIVAFMGQVSVKVRGRVKAGDYIAASGLHDGIGKAISPDDMTIDKLSSVVGTAWDSSEEEADKMINTAIGVQSNLFLIAGLQEALKTRHKETTKG